MSNKGQSITLSIGTLNARGLRAKSKRKAIMRQAKDNCDLLLLQDTHLDNKMAETTQKEFVGNWAFNHRSNDSGGVAIYNNEKVGRLLVDDNEDYTDKNGSLIGRTLKINETKLYVISAYAPCCGRSTQVQAINLAFLKELEKLIIHKKAQGMEIVVTGDLNFIRDAYLDADGGDPTVYKGQTDWLQHMEDDLGMIDAMRFLRPDEKMFTWSRTGCFRRLDYILCSKYMLEKAAYTTIIPVPSSDHRLIGIKLIIGKDTSGPGIWRHNDKALNDDEYKKAITDCITEVKGQVFSNNTAKWEYCKFKIRETAIEFGKNRARDKRQEKKRIEGAYSKALENDNDQDEIAELRRHLHKIYEEEDDVIRFRAGLDNIEKGEKVTPFFFRTIEQNRKESNITSLKTDKYPSGTVTKKETMGELEQHFSKVFADQYKDKEIPPQWFDGIKRIPDELSKSLDENIKLNDITNALFKLMKEGKSPGNDGLTTTFYRAFWSEISDLVMGSLKEGWEKGKFSDSQRQSVIRMIEKKGKSKEKINGWRPISLMNVDIKLLAKVLAERLKLVCKEIIGEEQLAYIEGNDVHEGHLLLNKVLESARTKKLSGLMCCIDFKGAFDSVRHKLIFTTLEKMGLGENFISMLKSLYNENISAVLNYGTTTNWIQLERSCRQGDPVAAYLFILIMEVLINSLKKLKIGMKIGSLTLWSTVFADDLTLLLNSNKELTEALAIFEDFKHISGLEINYEKSEVMELNYSYEPSIGIPLVEQVKVTGIWFSLDYKVMLALNWDDVCKKVAGKLNMWKGRSLSEVGKSTVINAQISPIVLYVSTVMQMPPETEKALSKMTYRFLGNGSEKESRALLCKKKDNGGLGIPNWRARSRSAMALWAVKASKSKKPWTKLFSEPGIDWSSSSALTTVRSTHGVEGFAGQCITEWYRSAALLPASDTAYIWPYINQPSVAAMMRKKCPNLTFDKAVIGLPTTLNFIEKAQIRSSMEDAKRRHHMQCNSTAYDCRKSLQKDLNCVKWSKPVYNTKGELRPIGLGKLKDHQQWLSIKLAGKSPTNICSLKSIYWLHIDNIIPPSHPFRNKIEFEYGIINWDKLDKLKTSTYSRQQSFHWRSTHGKLYTNKHFHAMGIKQDAKCSYCGEESQTLNHLFLKCNTTKQLFACFENQYKLTDRLTDLEKLLGVDPSSNRPKLIMKKLGILRRMLYQSNHKDEKPRWNTFLELVDKVYTYEYAIADRNGKIPQHFKIWEK